MSTKMVQIRNVSSDVVDVLKSRAAARGQSLSDYLRIEIEAIASEPSMEEVLSRMKARPRRDVGVSGAELIRETRDDYDNP